MRLEHVGIAVDDPEAATRFFERLLGVCRYKQETVGEQGVRTHFLPAGASKLELLEALGPDSPIGRFLSKRGAGLHHLAFEVADVDAVHARIRERGLTPIGEAPHPGADGKRVFFLHPKETFGVLVEFCQSVPTPLEATHVPYRGGHLAAYEQGARAQPAVVVLHGAAGCTALETEPLVRRLAPHVRVLALDFSGHGASGDVEGPFSADLFVDNVRAVLDHFEIGRAHLFGFSMGGYVALEFARCHPERIGRLAVHGTCIDWSEAQVAATTAPLAPAGVPPHVAQSLETAHVNWTRLFERTAAFVHTLPAQTDAMRERMEALSAPVLVSAVDRDDVFPLDAALDLHRRLPDARLALLPGTRHALPALDLDAYVPLLLNHFLGRE